VFRLDVQISTMCAASDTAKGIADETMVSLERPAMHTLEPTHLVQQVTCRREGNTVAFPPSAKSQCQTLFCPNSQGRRSLLCFTAVVRGDRVRMWHRMWRRRGLELLREAFGERTHVAQDSIEGACIFCPVFVTQTTCILQRWAHKAPAGTRIHSRKERMSSRQNRENKQLGTSCGQAPRKRSARP